METDGVSDTHRQAAAGRPGLLEKVQRRRPPGRAGSPRRPQVMWNRLWLFRRIAEIDGDHSLNGGSVAVLSVRLEPPLLDGNNGRPAQNKISANNFQILDAAIAPDQGFEHNRSVKLLRLPFRWIQRIHGVNQQG